MGYKRISESPKKCIEPSSRNEALKLPLNTIDPNFINEEFVQKLKGQTKGDESIKLIFERSAISLREAIIGGYETLKPPYKYTSQKLTSNLISQVAGLVSAILRNSYFCSPEETIIEQREFVIDGMTYRATIERVGASKEIDAKDYRSFSFRPEVQAAEKAWIRILEKVTPSKRKITMFRATREMLDMADKDVGILREEMERLIVGNRILKWAERLDKCQTAKSFIKDHWKKYIDAGLVTVALMREYDIGFYSHLAKSEKTSEKKLYESILSITDKNRLEVGNLNYLGYAPEDIVRLSATAQKKVMSKVFSG